MEVPRGRREFAGLGHRDEIAQLLELHPAIAYGYRAGAIYVFVSQALAA
jgi:hypothetical protein